MAMVDGETAEAKGQSASSSLAEAPRELASRHRRKWLCPHCDQAFKKREHRMRHVLSHTKEKPFACGICPKSYGRRDSLIRHARTHGRVGGDSLAAMAGLPIDAVAAVDQRTPVRRSQIQDDMLSSTTSPDEPACFGDPMDPMVDNVDSHHRWVAPGGSIEPASNLSPAIHSSTHTQAAFPSSDQVSNDWGGWTDLDLFAFGGNTHEPPWLVGASFDITALASSMSAAGSPRGHARVPADLTQGQTDEPSNGAYGTVASGTNIRNLVRGQWHTRPRVEGAYSYAPTTLKSQDQVDEAYRAGLSHRLHPCLHDDVLPSADFLNTCIKLYFAKFQPIFPIVHAPSFRPSSDNAPLLLSICSVGALFVGSASAAACGRRIFVKLNKAILASWEVYLYRGGHEALAVAQAVALGQTFGMLSGNPNDLLMTESFHVTIIAWARQAGMFQNKNSLQSTAIIHPDDLETAWKSWSQAEETIRFLLALHIHDSEFAAIFHHEPLLRHETGRLPRCCPDELFVASTAAQWHTMIKSLHSSSSFSEPQDHEFPDRTTIAKFDASMNAYALLAGHSAAICEARCATLNEAMIADFRCRLTSWYEAYSPSIRYPGCDPHCLMVLWHEAFMLLYVSFDWIERLVGREGQSMRPGDLTRIRSWVAEVQGQRCAIHAMLICKRLQTLPISAELGIHVPKALFYAGLVIYCRAKFRSTEAPHVEMDITELRWSGFGCVSALNADTEPPTASLDQFDSSTLYNVADLLRRQGHWELSRRFASIVEVLIDDLAGS